MLGAPCFQTNSIESVVRPLASKVATLLALTENPKQGDFASLIGPVEQLRTAVKNLTDGGWAVSKSSNDKVLHKEMAIGCKLSGQSAAALEDEITRISSLSSLTNCKRTYEAIEGIMNGTLKILIAWDDSEVRKIIEAARVCHDRLRLVQAAKSMRGLFVCYAGFTESMTTFLQLALQRQAEMNVRKKKEKLQQALMIIRSNLQPLCDSTKRCIRNPSMKEEKNQVVEVISTAIRNIIEAVGKDSVTSVSILKTIVSDKESSTSLTNVTSDTKSTEDGSETLATNIVKVIGGLTSAIPTYDISPRLDVYIAAILKNSEAVAIVSKQHYKDEIMRLREEIKSLREKLGDCLKELQANPTSQHAKGIFDHTADVLCNKFIELDRVVAQSVADQVAETFFDTSAPIKKLMKAVAPPSLTDHTSESEYTDSEYPDDIQKEVKLFRRDSLKLTQVAVQAAQGTLDRKRASQVKTIAGELTDLTSPVVSTALKVKQDNGAGHSQLHDIGKKWGLKAQELKTAVDEIISPVEFTAATEANIAGEMTKCRKAIKNKKWEELREVTGSIAAKGRRLIEVGGASLETVKDPLKKQMVTESLQDLEKNINFMLEEVERLCNHGDDREEAESIIARCLHNILTEIQHLQEIIPDTSVSNSLPPEIKRRSLMLEELPTSTSTPISAAPFTAMNHVGWTSSSDSDDGSPIIHSYLGKDHFTGSNDDEKFKNLSVGTQVLRPHDQSIGTQMSDEMGVSIGTQVTPPTNDLETPPTTLPGIYRALSPSDEWIYHTSTKDTSPSSFAPTNISTVDDLDFSDHATPPPGQSHVTKPVDHIVQYPTSLEGLNVTPSLQRVLNNQSDFSLTSEVEKEDTMPPHMTTYTQPLHSVVAAAREGDSPLVNTNAAILDARTSRLVRLADTASTTVGDQTLAGVLQEKSARLAHLTPQIIRQAKLKAQGKTNEVGGATEDLDLMVHQWAGHVRSLLDASQKANQPWSHTARRLVTSAKKRKGLNKEIQHISGQCNRMVGVATSSIEAATTEDYIGSTDNLQHQVDPDVQGQIDHIQSHISDIQTITPDFISTAKQLAGDSKEEGEEHVTIAMEQQLDLLSHEWATKASALLKGVDDITIGMSGPADGLLIAATSGDPALLDEQCRSIVSLSKSMLKISEDSVLGCDDKQLTDTVLNTAHLLIEISEELVGCAKGLVGVVTTGGEEHQMLVEKAEILRRDWSAKMHLLTAHIDDLTASVAGPLDRLVSVALQASRTEGMAKDHLLGQFEDKATFTKTQLELVSSELKTVVSGVSTSNPSLNKCLIAIAFLVQVSPRAMEAARVLSRDPSSAKLDHFSHLRRLWASKAQNFRAHLNSLELEINTDTLEMAFHDLLQGHRSFRRRSITPTAMEGGRYRPLGQKGRRGEGLESTPLVRSYSTEDLEAPLGPPPPIPLEQEVPLSSLPVGSSEPATPLKYNATPTKVIFRTPRSFTPDLSSKRHMSLGPLPSWDEGNDSTASVMDESSASIAVAARTLKDTVDQFMEEGNPFIAVAKKMSYQMHQMSQFARGKGELQSKSEMIQTAKAIAANAEQISRYATSVAEQCQDERSKTSLQSSSDMIPTLSTQLKIIASVKSCNPNDLSADVMLVKNAQNLMGAVIGTIQAAEAAYMKGLKPQDDSGEFDSVGLAIEWKRKLYIQRTMETINAPMGAKGLRKFNKRNRFSTPSLAELLSPSQYKGNI